MTKNTLPAAGLPKRTELDDTAVHQQVFAERMRQYMSNERLAAASGALPSAYLASFIWGQVEHWQLVAWWLCLFLVDMTTVLHTTLYLKAGPSTPRKNSWLQRQVILQTLAGLIWGSAYFMVIPLLDTGIEAYTGMILVAVNIIANIALLPFRRAMISWTIGLWLPVFSIHLGHASPRSLQLAIGIVVLVVSLNFYLWKASRDLALGIEERFRASALAAALQSAVERINELATRDELTGLLNRREGMTRFADMMASNQHRRLGDQTNNLAVLLLDIDHFKQVNDTYGHPAGDAVLRSVAQRMQAQMRPEDVVARIGGEEFLVLLPMTPENAVWALTERIRTSIAQTPINCGGTELSITISIGVVTQVDNVSIEKVLVCADEALYEAKRSGRNRTVVSPHCR